jgi:hypothetical protein
MNSALTAKLLGHLHRIFDKDPGRELALRLRYPAGTLTWKIIDGVLTTLVGQTTPLLLGGTWILNGTQALDGDDGYATSSLNVDLADHTIGSLIDFIGAQPGYAIAYQATGMLHLSALVLLDGEGDQDASNGDHLYGYTSLLWSYVSSLSSELNEALIAITEMLKQMSIRLASGEWLDEHGGYYKVPRILGESDPAYGPRIIAETLRPKGNNKAIEAAIYEATGMRSNVIDAATYVLSTNRFDGTWNYDGSRNYNSGSADNLRCLFDVTLEYDLLGDNNVTEYLATVAEQVDRLRDAGTHLRQIGISGDSTITDDYDYPMSDYAEITIQQIWYYNGSVRFDGTADFGRRTISTETLD